MSTIAAGTTSGTALVSTGNTAGTLVFQTNGTTTALTLGTDQSATFVGAVTAPSFSGTSSTATNLAGGSNGTIPYQSAAGTTQMLAVGTAGQVLQTNGAGAPSWVTPSAGAMTLLATVTASNSATVSFGSSYITSSYSAYIVMFSGWVPDNDRPQYYLKMSSNNNSTFLTCNWCVTRVDSGSVSVMANSSGTDIPIISTGTFSTSSANGGGSGSLYIYNPSSTSVGKTVEWFIGGYSTNSGGEEIWNGTATYRTAGTAVNAIQFYNAGGNIATGIFKLYGIQ